MDLKAPISIDEQLEKLKAQGMIITNDAETKKMLSEINYYRFTGYALRHRIQPDKSNYVSGTTFDEIYSIYMLDEAIRNILRKYIERVEVYYRTLIAHNYALAKCIDPPHDQHYDENNFYNKTGYQQVMESFKKEKNYYKDSLIVKHHKLKYNNRMPLWVIVELISFSNTSKLYNSMYESERNLIASKAGTGGETLVNHLHCLSVLRNKCAHAARLYDTTFYPPAKFTTKYLKSHPELNNKTLFAYILVLLRRLPDIRYKQKLADDIIYIAELYARDIDLEAIGFPENYKSLLYSNINIS